MSVTYTIQSAAGELPAADGSNAPRSSAHERHVSFNTARRRSNVSIPESLRNEIPPEDLLSLMRTASAISGHREDHDRQSKLDNHLANNELHVGSEAGVLPPISRPMPVKAGTFETINEVPSQFATPFSTRPPSPVSTPQTPRQGSDASYADFDIEDNTELAYPDVGTLKSWRGALVLVVTCGAQLMDNVFMTGVNISLPAIQKDFGVDSGDLQWLISAYTLTFGGFLLLAGVMSDRYGRKNIFGIGMVWLAVWTLGNGFATSFIQMAIFRGLQGIGAAMTVPSGVGIISAFFVAQDRQKALSYFGAAGAVGFCVGLLLGGFLTSSLGWRYLFYISVVGMGLLSAVGIIILPKDRLEGHVRPRLDILGSAISTTGLILLSFVISSGGEYGWSKPFIIAILIMSVSMLFIFTWVEKKVQNPIMPLSIWKMHNFAGIWIAGFVAYGNYQTVIYYMTLIAQEVMQLSAGATALRLLPMGAVGGTTVIVLGRVMDRFDAKHLLLIGLALCTIAPIPCAVMEPDSVAFWSHVFPTSVIVVAGIAITYCTSTVVLLESVPVEAKSLCGGMVNTAYQIGSGVGLALASAVVTATETKKGHGALAQYKMGMWCCVALAGVGFSTSLFAIKGVKNGKSQPMGMH